MRILTLSIALLRRARKATNVAPWLCVTLGLQWSLPFTQNAQHIRWSLRWIQVLHLGHPLLVALGLLVLFGCQRSTNPPIETSFLVAPAIAYHPRGFAPGSEFALLTREQLITDLRLLRKEGFRSLVTYSANGVLGDIPQIARQEGFDGTVIMGLWDITSDEEWNNAVAQVSFVDGYCMGNEGLGIRYSPERLAFRMDELRRETRRPVTTTEPIDSYLTGPHQRWLLEHSDWLFPLAHPVWASQIDADQAVGWILARVDYLTASARRRVILKEAGFPSAGPAGYNEDTQLAFFSALEATGLAFFYFEAFDQPWKRDVLRYAEIEAHWGLHRADGTLKKVMAWLVSR